VTFKSVTGEALAYTFEDALFYRNIGFFDGRAGTGLAGKFRRNLVDAVDLGDLAVKVRESIRGADKAEFALDMLYSEDIDKLQVPAYIENGLLWLINQLKRKEDDLAPKAKP
jgi:hypothetical protein